MGVVGYRRGLPVLSILSKNYIFFGIVIFTIIRLPRLSLRNLEENVSYSVSLSPSKGAYTAGEREIVTAPGSDPVEVTRRGYVGLL